MLRSRTVHTIQELALQGKSISEIARTVNVTRQSVRKYRDGAPPPKPRKPRPTKLDPFKAQIRRWVQEDHLFNCVTMLERLKTMGYTGGISQLKAFVHPLRSNGRRAVRRYETKPGEQMQFDWGEFVYEEGGVARKLSGFTAILSYSRMRFVTFVKRADTPTMLRCLMGAFEYFGGLPGAVLTDRMKSVLLSMEDGEPHWNSYYASTVDNSSNICGPFEEQVQGHDRREQQGQTEPSRQAGLAPGAFPMTSIFLVILTFSQPHWRRAGSRGH